MCTPLAFAATAAAISAAGVVTSGIGQAQQARAAQRTYEHNARVELMLEQEELRAGREEEKAHALEVRRLLSRQTMASRGIDFSSEFFDNVYDDTLLMAQLDSELILENARRRAFGHRAAASGLQMQASAARGQRRFAIAGAAVGTAAAISSFGYNVARGSFTPGGEGTAYRGVGSLGYEPPQQGFGTFRWES